MKQSASATVHTLHVKWAKVAMCGERTQVIFVLYCHRVARSDDSYLAAASRAHAQPSTKAPSEQIVWEMARDARTHLRHARSLQNVLDFNCHVPTSAATDKRKRDVVQKPMEVGKEAQGNGVAQPAAA